MSWKRWEHASCFENLAKTPSTEKRKWIMFSIKLFWGSIFRDEGVSHPESKVWGKHRNNSYTFFELMNSGLCLILWIFVDSFCLGRAKSRCGGVLVVDFYDFYRQHFSRIHDLRANTNQIWFILAKFGQNGRNPRPTGRPIPHGVWCSSLVRVLMSANASQSNVVSYKIHKPRPKGLSQGWLGPHAVLQLNPKPGNCLWEEYAPIDQHVGESEGREGESLGRPA